VQFFKSLSIKKKLFLILGSAQGASIVALAAGYIGISMLGASFDSLYNNAVKPLGELRLVKSGIEQDIVLQVKNMKEGKVGSDENQTLENIYAQTLSRVTKADEQIQANWGAYCASYKSKQEEAAMPEINEIMGHSLESIAELKKILQNKEFPALLDFAESEMPLYLEAAPKAIDKLMEIHRQMDTVHHLHHWRCCQPSNRAHDHQIHPKFYRQTNDKNGRRRRQKRLQAQGYRR
jgi:methyl-accepting chemotaxis protein